MSYVDNIREGYGDDAHNIVEDDSEWAWDAENQVWVWKGDNGASRVA